MAHRIWYLASSAAWQTRSRCTPIPVRFVSGQGMTVTAVHDSYEVPLAPRPKKFRVGLDTTVRCGNLRT